MPSDSVIGKDGTFFTIDTYNYLARFETCNIDFTTDTVEHTSPQDDVKHFSPTQISWTASGANFIGNASAELLRAQWRLNETPIGFQANLWDGGTFNGSGYLSVGATAANDPNKENWTMQGTGTWAFS